MLPGTGSFPHWWALSVRTAPSTRQTQPHRCVSRHFAYLKDIAGDYSCMILIESIFLVYAT